MSAYRVIDKMESVVREGVWMPFGWKALNFTTTLSAKLSNRNSSSARSSSNGYWLMSSGVAASSVRVYSWLGVPTICWVSPSSTIPPLCITAMRVAR